MQRTPQPASTQSLVTISQLARQLEAGLVPYLSGSPTDRDQLDDACALDLVGLLPLLETLVRPQSRARREELVRLWQRREQQQPASHADRAGWVSHAAAEDTSGR